MRKLVALATLLLLAACGSDSTGPGQNSVAGTYALQTAGGSNLPAVVLQAGVEKLEITAGSITLNQDQTFSTSISTRYTNGSDVTTDTSHDTGTYARNNNALQLNYSDGTTDAGSVSGRTLTLTSEGVVFVFQR